MPDTPWYIYLLGIAAGFLAGGINTLSGSGSLLTLPMLMFLGLPANVANGTNRVGIVLQTLISTLTLKKKGKLSFSGTEWLLIPSILGALAGSFIAADLDEKTMNFVIGSVMVLMLVLVVTNTESWLRAHSETKENSRSIRSLFLFFAIGFYGGFIQVGVGIFLLSAMVLYSGMALVHANAVKNYLVLVYTIPALAIFIYNNQVDWYLGSLMAAGQGMGAWTAARFATGFKNANLWIRRLIITVILISVFKLFGGFDYLASILKSSQN